MSRQQDTFFERYAQGTIASPVALAIDDIVAWFAGAGIVAGVWSLDQKNFVFIIPIDRINQAFVGTVTEAYELTYDLLLEQMAILLAKKYSVDVDVLDTGAYEAVWDKAEIRVEDAFLPTYIVSKAAPESVVQMAYSLRQSIEYSSLERVSVWRVAEPVGWFDAPLLSRELPAFVFDGQSVSIRYKVMAEPVTLLREAQMQLSFPGALHLNMETVAGSVVEEIRTYRLRPGGEIDTLQAAGVIARDAHKEMIDAIEHAESDMQFTRDVAIALGIPAGVVTHIVNSTMPENTQVQRASSWWNVFTKSVEEYGYEPDPNAGPLKKMYAYISARPLLDWSYMIAEALLGGAMIALVTRDMMEFGTAWWRYALIVIGALFFMEGVFGIIIRLRRKAAKRVKK